jgi:hypothetical protein
MKEMAVSAHAIKFEVRAVHGGGMRDRVARYSFASTL